MFTDESHDIPWLYFLSGIYFFSVVNNCLIFHLWFCVLNINSSPQFTKAIKLLPVKSNLSCSQKVPFSLGGGQIPPGDPQSSSHSLCWLLWKSAVLLILWSTSHQHPENSLSLVSWADPWFPDFTTWLKPPFSVKCTLLQ